MLFASQNDVVGEAADADSPRSAGRWLRMLQPVHRYTFDTRLRP